MKGKSIGIKQQDLYNSVFVALKELGGSGSVNEINNKVIENNKYPPAITDVMHNSTDSRTELEYILAWTRTALKMVGVLSISSKSIWVITPKYATTKSLDNAKIHAEVLAIKKGLPATTSTIKDDKVDEVTDDMPNWKVELSDVLHKMDPFGFEKLSMYLLRECGFSEVNVTKNSGDGGIDGTGKLKINGIFSLNVAFQCKRYKGSVGADIIRDFRGSLSTDIEKGVLITTGAFTSASIRISLLYCVRVLYFNIMEGLCLKA